MFPQITTITFFAITLFSAVFAAPLTSSNLTTRTTSYSGIATFFFQNGNAGACGKYHSDYDHIVALQTSLFANGKHCGAKISIKNKNTGKTTTATVADECPTCDGHGSIDLSKGLFEVFASTSEGIFPVTWHFD